MRAKKPQVLSIASVLTEVASHTAMGVALGLAFALIILAVDQYGIAGLINEGAAQGTTRLEFVGFVVLAFALGVTLTGLAFMLTEDDS
jgi:pilus assembly protein TadC